MGSGVFARTFVQAERMVTTTRGGPPIEDVHRRTIWSLSKGKVIDDRIVDDTPDHILNRYLDEADDLRVELTMKNALDMYHRHAPDVVEVYSQPRVAVAAAEYDKDGTRLQPGFSLDLTRADPATGLAWDLSDKKVQARVVRLITSTAPLFVIGSPPCTAFSRLQALSRAKRDPAVVASELESARVHLRFCMRLYKMQVLAGRFFVHEHPHGADSWQEDSVMEVLAMRGVEVASVYMCAYGMRVNVGPVQGPARKQTKIMSNSREVLRRVAVECPNKSPDVRMHHEHVPLEQGRAKRCQVYPREFSRKVCEGIAAEKRCRNLGLASIDLVDIGNIEISNVEFDISEGKNAAGILHEHHGATAFDDQSGEPLVPALVKQARL